MKSRTSFFNATVLRKDITRFAPAWGLYTVFMLLFVLLMWEGEGTAARFVSNAPYIMQYMGMLNIVYAGLCAVLLFGDLFKTRMCNALHALPLRREGWFLTHLTAGLLFCIVPNAFGAALSALLLLQYCYGAFLWLAVVVLQFLFFFGVGAFCVTCAGNRLGAVTMYGIFNFFAVLATWLVETFYEPFLYGIELDKSLYVKFSPVVAFTEFKYVDIRYNNLTSTARFWGFLSEQWRYLFVAAAVGVVLTALAVLIYRRRRLESAGDFISARPAAPVFLVIYTLCAGAVMYFVADVVSEEIRYIFLFIGFAIGFFTGRMLLERKVNVFGAKNFLAFGAILVIFAASIGLTWLDPAGITRYVPQAQQVASVKISPYSSQYYRDNNGFALTDPADIEAITQIHSDLVENRSMDGDMFLHILYEMNNGTTVERTYYLDSGSAAAQKTLKGFYSVPAYVFGTGDVQGLIKNAYQLEFISYRDGLPNIAVTTDENWMDMEDFQEKYGSCLTYVTEEGFDQAAITKGLIEAIEADCLAGNMAQIWEFHKNQETCGYVTIQYVVPTNNTYVPYTTKYLDITIYEDCANTIRYLESLTAQ